MTTLDARSPARANRGTIADGDHGRILISGGIAYYECRRLMHDTHLRGAARVAVTLVVAASIAPMIIANLAHRGSPPRVAGLLAWPACSSAGSAGFTRPRPTSSGSTST